MKKILIYSACALFLSGCESMDQFTRSVFATQTGAAIGNVTGSIIGGNLGGYRGSFMGSVLGTAAGAMIGASIVARDQNAVERPREETPVPSPYLVIKDIRLQDENWNRVVEPNENCVLIFEIHNNGERTAYDIKPVLQGLEGTKQLTYSSPLIIDQIKPGDGVLYKVNLTASPNIKTGDANFEIRLDERNGYGTQSEEFSIKTQGRL